MKPATYKKLLKDLQKIQKKLVIAYDASARASDERMAWVEERWKAAEVGMRQRPDRSRSVSAGFARSGRRDSCLPGCPHNLLRRVAFLTYFVYPLVFDPKTPPRSIPWGQDTRSQKRGPRNARPPLERENARSAHGP